MGGICQCPACGDLYYGDERDNYQTCRCGADSVVIALTREQADILTEALDQARAAWRDREIARNHGKRVDRTPMDGLIRTIADQLKGRTHA